VDGIDGHGMSTTPVTTPPRGLAAPPEALDDDPPARVLMSPIGPSEVSPTTRVVTALQIARERGSDHLVVRGDGEIRAVAEVDLQRHLLEAGVRPSRMLDPVSAVATRVHGVGPETRRSRAVELMLAQDRPVLVVVENGEPCGLLDARSVLRSLAGGRDHRPTP
jgi:CBS domain-containing protein